MTVYIDVLFMVNVIINYFLLLITGIFSKAVCNRVRIIIASLLGGLYCAFAFVSEFAFLQSAVLKILSTVAISLIAFKYISPRNFLRCTLLLFFVGFLFGGIVYGICFLANPSFMSIKNATVYIHISPILLILCSVVSYISISLFNYALKPQSNLETCQYSVTIIYREKSVSASGFLDTGNNLTDVFSDYPVILCNFETVSTFFDEKEKLCFEGTVTNVVSSPSKNNFRVIPISTVAGSALLPAFKPDLVLLKTKSEQLSISRVFVAVFNKKNYNSPHEIILNPELINNKSQGGTKNVL